MYSFTYSVICSSVKVTAFAAFTAPPTAFFKLNWAIAGVTPAKHNSMTATFNNAFFIFVCFRLNASFYFFKKWCKRTNFYSIYQSLQEYFYHHPVSSTRRKVKSHREYTSRWPLPILYTPLNKMIPTP